VEIIVGEQTQLYDKVLVTYELENRDKKVHTIGLREMIDTYIGANDGVPFYVPPMDDIPARLVDTKAVLQKEKVPQFLRALESADPASPGAAVAELGLRLRGCDLPESVVICRWPQEHGGSEARWDWPFQAMNEPKGAEKDSCVVIYWAKQKMNPKEKRVLAYTYGLGKLAEAATQTAKGRVRLFSGPATVKKPFVLTAYVKGDNQKVTLQLLEGLTLAKGQQAQQVSKVGAGQDYAVLSWLVEAKKPGKYPVKAVLDGNAAEESVNVLETSLFE
jgi:hypothetical protein